MPPAKVTAPTVVPKVRLLSILLPVSVMVPVLVVAGPMMRSSMSVVVAVTVPAPPVELVFQKAPVFHAPTTVLNPAVVPFTSQ